MKLITTKVFFIVHEFLFNLIRRILFCFCLTLSFVATADSNALPKTESLRLSLANALESGKPLVVMVSLEGCPYCHIARQNYLSPLHREQGLHVVQLDMGSTQPIENFDGNKLTQSFLIKKWGVQVAPTLIFFGAGGTEVAPRMVGGYIPDFYGAYLDDRLLQALKAIRP